MRATRTIKRDARTAQPHRDRHAEHSAELRWRRPTAEAAEREGDALSAQYDSEGRLSPTRSPPVPCAWTRTQQYREARMATSTAANYYNPAGELRQVQEGAASIITETPPPHCLELPLAGSLAIEGLKSSCSTKINVPPRPTDRHHPLGCARHSGPLNTAEQITALGTESGTMRSAPRGGP